MPALHDTLGCFYMAEVRRKGDLDNAAAKLENGVKAGLMLAGQLVAQRAQLIAPIDTGRLKRSLTTGEPFKQDTAWRIDIGSNVVYARIQEFGGRAGRNLATLITAQPYLRPALKASKAEVRTVITRAVIGALKR